MKFIPCQGYGEILNSRVPTSVIQYLQESDFQDPFVIEHKGTVTVGLYAKQYLFIGIRGTVFLNDWKINLHLSLSRARRTPCIRAFPHPLRGRAHTGFLKEATRIVTDLMRETHKQNRTKVSHTFFSGHSLGGAVAALTSNLLSKNASSTCIFGAPRYCDSTGTLRSGLGRQRTLRGAAIWYHPYLLDGWGTQTTPVSSIRTAYLPRRIVCAQDCSICFGIYPYSVATSLNATVWKVIGRNLEAG